MSPKFGEDPRPRVTEDGLDRPSEVKENNSRNPPVSLLLCIQRIPGVEKPVDSADFNYPIPRPSVF